MDLCCFRSKWDELCCNRFGCNWKLKRQSYSVWTSTIATFWEILTAWSFLPLLWLFSISLYVCICASVWFQYIDTKYLQQQANTFFFLSNEVSFHFTFLTWSFLRTCAYLSINCTCMHAHETNGQLTIYSMLFHDCYCYFYVLLYLRNVGIGKFRKKLTAKSHVRQWKWIFHWDEVNTIVIYRIL